MNKKWLMIGGVLLSALVLAWCFGKSKDSKTEEFTVASCNDYVKLMRCVADKSGESSSEAHAVIDQAVSAWKTLPESDLNQVCSQALATAVAYKSTYEEKWCEVPNSNDTVIDENNATSGADSSVADPSVIETVSGEVDTIASGTVALTSGDNNDSDVVKSVIDNTTGVTQ